MDRKELNYEYSSEEGTLDVYVDNVKLKGSGAEVDAGLRKSGYSKVKSTLESLKNKIMG